MEVHIFDVEHGSCTAVASPSGRLLLVDCGHNDTTGWRPSGWISARGGVIDNFVITNFDEDHLTDLPNVRRSCQIRSFTVNWNVSPDWIRRTKSQFGMGPGVLAAVQMMESRAGYDPRDPLLLGPGVSIDWGDGCLVEYFYHTPAQFPDENGLSVVTFVQYRAIRIVFPGDLTAPAWRAFLLNPRFRALLGVTNIFIASHHGRRDGYCPDVFDVCRPAGLEWFCTPVRRRDQGRMSPNPPLPLRPGDVCDVGTISTTYVCNLSCDVACDVGEGHIARFPHAAAHIATTSQTISYEYIYKDAKRSQIARGKVRETPTSIPWPGRPGALSSVAADAQMHHQNLPPISSSGIPGSTRFVACSSAFSQNSRRP